MAGYAEGPGGKGVYAQIYTVDGASGGAQLVATDSEDELERWDSDGQSNECSPDQTNHEVMIDHAGLYLILLSLSFSSGTAGVIWAARIAVGGVGNDAIKLHRKCAANDVGNANAHGILSLSANDEISVLISHDNGGGVNFDMEDGQLSVIRLDGSG